MSSLPFEYILLMVVLVFSCLFLVGLPSGLRFFFLLISSNNIFKYN